jgi:hypothetical protein
MNDFDEFPQLPPIATLPLAQSWCRPEVRACIALSPTTATVDGYLQVAREVMQVVLKYDETACDACGKELNDHLFRIKSQNFFESYRGVGVTAVARTKSAACSRTVRPTCARRR